MKYFTYDFGKHGKLTLAEKDKVLCGLHFGSIQLDGEYIETTFLKEVKKQLDEYFSGSRREFKIPIAPEGTEFQKAVWRELEKIPYGKTKTYGEIAAALNNPNGMRAVGMACGKNPIGIIIPCHRVIAKSGKLQGFAGGLALKEALLQLEK